MFLSIDFPVNSIARCQSYESQDKLVRRRRELESIRYKLYAKAQIKQESTTGK